MISIIIRYVARQPVEATTVVFRQPDDEVPRTRAPESIVGKGNLSIAL